MHCVPIIIIIIVVVVVEQNVIGIPDSTIDPVDLIS